MQGEYVIPPNAAIPLSAADMALVTGVSGGTTAAQRPPFEQSGSGRWRVQARHSGIQCRLSEVVPIVSHLSERAHWLTVITAAPACLSTAAQCGSRTALGAHCINTSDKSGQGSHTVSPAFQVNVPGADLGEILPAARLLSRATALTPTDYERAKGLFLAGVDRAGLAAEVLAECFMLLRACLASRPVLCSHLQAMQGRASLSGSRQDCCCSMSFPWFESGGGLQQACVQFHRVAHD